MNTKKIYIKNINRTNDILKCVYSNNRYLITFKDHKTYPYSTRDIKIVKIDEKQLTVDNKLQYFKDIANQIGLTVKNEKNQSINILDKNYQKIDEVKEESILFNYLTENLPKEPKPPKGKFGSFFRLIKSKDDNLKNAVIYPFGFNISQGSAVEKAINNKLSIIEGPPGTGKTQTILNIIANAIMHNENIAVVSSNNSATKNIIDKLKKYEVDFIAAYLGSSKNRQEFIDAQSGLPDIGDWFLTNKELEKLYKNIQIKFETLKKCY